MTPPDALRLADGLAGPDGEGPLTVLVAPGTAPAAVESLGLPGHASVSSLADGVPDLVDGAVLLAVHDATGLLRALPVVARLGGARRVGCWFERPPAVLPSVAVRSHWPAATRVTAAAAPECFVLVDFVRPAPAGQVLAAVARSVAGTPLLTAGWPSVGARTGEPARWPVGDAAAVVDDDERLFDRDADYPPDVTVVDTPPEGLPRAADHHVLGRSPVTHVVGAELAWSDCSDLDSPRSLSELAARGPLSLGALEEHLLNPAGFHRMSSGRAVELEPAGPDRLAVAAPGGRVVLDSTWGLSDADLPALRRVPGLRLGWSGTRGPQAYARTVVGLAAAGVPLVAEEVPAWARRLLDPALVAALEHRADLSAPLPREEHSLRLRRSALRGHGTRGWRRRLAAAEGLQAPAVPRVSVLLPTRRPEMLDFALRQVARQRGVDLELVLVTHGFTADETRLDRFRAESGFSLVALAAPTSMLFGAVLNLAADRATGDVFLKMDDDDWYGPDFVADLLLARDYSSAEVVGCPPEFTFVEPLWLTTRRPDHTEKYRPFVAGGTIMIDRGVFRAVGGFRETRKYVDASLLSAVAQAGGRVYRTQGLGYVLRRSGRGHTWDPGLGYFLERARTWEQWRGFRPSAVLEPDDRDLPARVPDREVTP